MMPSGVPSRLVAGSRSCCLVAEDEGHHRVAGGVELRNQHGLKPRARRNRDRKKLVGLIQQRSAVARGTRAGLEVRRIDAEVRRQVLEEDDARAVRTACGRAAAPAGLPGEREHAGARAS